MMANLKWLIIVWFNCGSIIPPSSASSSDEATEVHFSRFVETQIWDVGVVLLKSFQNGVRTESPKFSIWNGTVEERFFLRLFPNGYLPKHEGRISIYLVSQNDFATMPGIELFVLNKKPEQDIRKVLATTYVKFDQSSGWGNFFKLDTLLDPSQGFIFDDKVKFGVKFMTDPAPIREPIDHKTFYWAVGLKTMDLTNGMFTDSLKFHSWAASGGLISWHLRMCPQSKARTNVTSLKNMTSFFAVFNGEPPYTTNMELFVKNVRSENIVRAHLSPTYQFVGDAWGKFTFINRDLLINPENGFVNDGEIVFGIRIPNFNVNPTEPKQVTVTHTWDVGLQSFELDHAGLDETGMESPQYIVWNRNKKEGWHLRLLPKGKHGDNKGFVSLFLVFGGNHTSAPHAKVFIVNKDQRNNIRRWLSTIYWASISEQSKGWPEFISREYLLDPSNGFVVDNKIKFGIQLRTDPLLPRSERPMITKIWEIGMECLQEGPGELESPIYEIKIQNVTEKWHLRLYPRGFEAENAGFVSMYLVSSNYGTIHPDAEVFILNEKPENTIRKLVLGMYKSLRKSTRWARFIKYGDLINEENGFVFGNQTKSIKVGFRMPLEPKGEIIPGDRAADPDPVIIPKKPNVQPTPGPPVSTSPSIPAASTAPSSSTPGTTTPETTTTETTTASPFQIEAFSSNLYGNPGVIPLFTGD